MNKYEPIHESSAFMGGGKQAIYRFDNDYGASVIRTPYSYGGRQGKFELAVLRFTGEEVDSYQLDYSTPLTSDVIGNLSQEEVEELLHQIAALPQPDDQEE